MRSATRGFISDQCLLYKERWKERVPSRFLEHASKLHVQVNLLSGRELSVNCSLDAVHDGLDFWWKGSLWLFKRILSFRLVVDDFRQLLLQLGVVLVHHCDQFLDSVLGNFALLEGEWRLSCGCGGSCSRRGWPGSCGWLRCGGGFKGGGG